MSYNDLFNIEFCPDTSEQLFQGGKMIRDGRMSLHEAKGICRSQKMRARVLKDDKYVGHLFEDGSYDEAKKK